jgi:hypothetical protein
MARRLAVVFSFIALLSACDHGAAPKAVAVSTTTTTTTTAPRTTATTTASTTTTSPVSIESTTTAVPQAATAIVTFRAPADLPIDQTLAGGGCVPSYADGANPTAYRCVLPAGSFYDPCFVDPETPDAVLCIEAIDPESATRLEHTTRSDDGRPSVDDAGPWVIDLINGERCGFALGATMAVGDERANYSCPSGWLYGDPDRSAAKWTIHFQATDTAPLTSVAIATAYY